MAAAAQHDVERAKRIADGLYGTILVLAVVAALSKDPAATAGAILGGVLATSVVFWLVHVYAAVLGRRASGDHRALPPLIRAAAHDEWALVESALAPSVPLLLGAVHILGRSTAIWLAIAVGLIDLAAWGYASGRALDQPRLKALLSGAGAVALGLVMVLLKTVVH